jgi:hypothetical protein
MRRKSQALLVVVCIVLPVLAGCGGGGSSSSSSKSFTVKVDYHGNTGYMVVSVPAAHEAAIRNAFIAKARKTKIPTISVTDQSSQGPLKCSESGKIGQHHSVIPAVRRYIGDQATVKIYGSGLVATSLCHALKQQGL